LSRDTLVGLGRPVETAEAPLAGPPPATVVMMLWAEARGPSKAALVNRTTNLRKARRGLLEHLCDFGFSMARGFEETLPPSAQATSNCDWQGGNDAGSALDGTNPTSWMASRSWFGTQIHCGPRWAQHDSTTATLNAVRGRLVFVPCEPLPVNRHWRKFTTRKPYCHAPPLVRWEASSRGST